MVLKFFQNDLAFQAWAKVYPSLDEIHGIPERYTWQSPIYALKVHIAASYGLAKVVEKLTLGQAHSTLPTEEYTIGVDDQDPTGKTPLFWSVWGHHKAVSELLIGKGALISAIDKRKCTPLHAAAEIGCLSLVKLLINGGACVSARNEENDTPLHAAAARGWDDVADRKSVV